MNELELKAQIEENSKKIDEGLIRLKEARQRIEELVMQDRMKYEEFMLKFGGTAND